MTLTKPSVGASHAEWNAYFLAERTDRCLECGHSFLKDYSYSARCYCYGCVPKGFKSVKRSGKVWPEPGARLRRRILADPCVYCGQPAEHVDHVVPKSLGGSFGEGNLAPACGPCNRAKGTMFVIEFKQWLKAVRSNDVMLVA